MTDLPQSPSPGASPFPPQGQPPIPPRYSPAPPAAAQRPPRRTSVVAILALVFLAFSLIANVVLVMAIVGLLGMGGATDIESAYLERTVEKGPSSSKIAVIHVDGIIDDMLVTGLLGELDRARDDAAVKAVIIRINSPGGGLTASDMLYHEIKTRLASKPVIASMDSVAASGGYFVACATRKIIAQETTVTGSIGVIAQFFFVSGLMKDKLGVVPVTLKMGRQKDWPNMWAGEMTPEQQDYLMNTLLKPGYDRFVSVVAESRGMPKDDVLELATGRIFMAPEAKAAKLIDEIGYFDHAITVAKGLAGVKEARVVEYVRPFSLGELFGLQGRKSDLQNLLDLRPERLAALASPKVMYLWTGI
jgi:protease-4